MKIILLYKILKKYLFQNKDYPVLLYNIYGSEGHGKDRYIVDEMIETNGFWKTVSILLNFYESKNS